MAIGWSDIEAAILAWFKASSGLSAVIWANQTAPQPALPYATLLIRPPARLAAQDDVQEVYVGSNPAGQEVELRQKGVREISVSCQVFSAAVRGAGTAREILAKAQTGLETPSLRQALYQAGLSVVDEGAITDVSALVETKYQSRAAMDVLFYCVDEVTEKTGYIETVNYDATYNP